MAIAHPIKSRIPIDPALAADAIVSKVNGQYEACAGNERIKQRRPHTDLFDNEHFTTRLALLNHISA